MLAEQLKQHLRLLVCKGLAEEAVHIAADERSTVFEGVCRAVDSLLGGPDLLYEDSSWLKYLGCQPSR